ncbi:cytochrome c oxidase subunit CcoM [Bacterioplanoides pacificum]|uniref:Cytochrome c oxidase subunit CcoM n=1 Tax=Bacterioplanoides pacificum TaxID=1171596 RepID=A0ABV7VTP3_9GAMM
MFMDEVVFAGLAIVTLTCAFFIGVYVAVKKDMKKHGTGE